MSPRAKQIESRMLNWAVTGLMALLSAIASYGTGLIRDVNVSIQELNNKVALIIADSANKDFRLERLEADVKILKGLKADAPHTE